MHDLTDYDYSLLDALRIERFREFFGLPSATIDLSQLDRTLIVSGSLKEIQFLVDFKQELQSEAWYQLAATSALVYCGGELILETEILESDLLLTDKLGEKVLGESMATAIQEKDLNLVTQENGNPQTSAVSARIVRSVSISDIAADLETTTDAIQQFFLERNATLVDFGGTILVPESEAVAAYEHYSLIRARQKMQQRFAATPSDEKPQILTKNTAPTKENKPKKPTLTFKGKFRVNRSNYKRTIQNFLDAMFPEKAEEQSLALDDIAQQSELGKAYLDKIIRIGEYKDKDHACANLLKAALEMLNATLAAPKEEMADSVA